MAVKRTSISLQPKLEKKADEITTDLLVKHKTKAGMATLLSGLLEMYDEKKHGAELRIALAELKKRDVRTTRHQNKIPADEILEAAVKPKKKAASKPQKKKPDTKAAMVRLLKGRK
jgi:hypothetical protein